MKCVKKNDRKGATRRVSDELAKILVEKKNYKYCPKSSRKSGQPKS